MEDPEKIRQRFVAVHIFCEELQTTLQKEEKIWYPGSIWFYLRMR